jgi:excisionase family DNA binding protein
VKTPALPPVRREGSESVQLPGGAEYARWIRHAYRSGSVTFREWLELRFLDAVLKSRGRPGFTVAELSNLHIDPTVLPRLILELGGSLPAPLCRYASHRPSDWLNADGQTVCGVCHPPERNVGRRSDRRPFHAVRAAVIGKPSGAATGNAEGAFVLHVDVDALATRIADILADRLGIPSQPSSPWLDVDRAAEYLCCSAHRVRKLVQRGAIPFHQERSGGRIFFNRRELDEWLSNQ